MLDFTTPESTNAVNLANEYIYNSQDGTVSPSNFADYFTFKVQQRIIFLQTLIKNTLTDLPIITLIDSDLDITGETNPEIRERWYTLGLYYQYNPVYAPCQTWVSEMGRNKYLHSVYTSLEDSGQTALGIQWYNDNINFYAPSTKLMLQEILGI